MLSPPIIAGKDVPEIKGSFPAGEKAALEALTGKNGFLADKRLKLYGTGRNQPNKPEVRIWSL